MNGLNAEVSLDEVRHVVFSMASLKAFGIDGLHAKLYQANWDIIGINVLRMVIHVLKGGQLDLDINKTLLVLITKVCNADFISYFRPINLCIILYKIITKMPPTGDAGSCEKESFKFYSFTFHF